MTKKKKIHARTLSQAALVCLKYRLCPTEYGPGMEMTIEKYSRPFYD
jgi:hypothetical protein